MSGTMKPVRLPPARGDPVHGARPAACKVAAQPGPACDAASAVRHAPGEPVIGQDDRTAWLAMAVTHVMPAPGRPASAVDGAIGPAARAAQDDPGPGCRLACGAPACLDGCVLLRRAGSAWR